VKPSAPVLAGAFSLFLLAPVTAADANADSTAGIVRIVDAGPCDQGGVKKALENRDPARVASVTLEISMDPNPQNHPVRTDTVRVPASGTAELGCDKIFAIRIHYDVKKIEFQAVAATTPKP